MTVLSNMDICLLKQNDNLKRVLHIYHFPYSAVYAQGKRGKDSIEMV